MRMLTPSLALLAALAALPPSGCIDLVPPGESDGGPVTPSYVLEDVAPFDQREGDAEAGRAELLNGGYVGCGVPSSLSSMVLGTTAPDDKLPGRDGKNAAMPYNYNAFATKSGVDVVHPNCLSCHASKYDGEIVIGLGNTSFDGTTDASTGLRQAGAFVTDPAEKEEYLRWVGRMEAVAPYIITRTVGVNAADNLAAALFAHRDRETLAWSDEPLLEMPPTEPLPVDVPPWWRMKKKNAMFYSANGRGDHARIMMTASTLCVDDVEQAEEIDVAFTDVRAYISSLEAPAWPYDVDDALAAQGRDVFEARCARCHGTYGEDGVYPNRVVDVDEVGTDSALAGSGHNADRFVDWFNGSFYGELSEMRPQPGYVAPPLDGIWLTAPFLHNGSVPDVEALLDSSQRPTFWSRDRSVARVDEERLGFAWNEEPAGHQVVTDAAKRRTIYDTTLPGYGNEGHTYGDALSDEDRRAVIEYLKTL